MIAAESSCTFAPISFHPNDMSPGVQFSLVGIEIGLSLALKASDNCSSSIQTGRS